MLTRLFGAVIKGVEYAEWEPEEENDALKQELKELQENCEKCPHVHDIGKEECGSCGISTSINNLEMELKEMEEN